MVQIYIGLVMVKYLLAVTEFIIWQNMINSYNINDDENIVTNCDFDSLHL